MSGINVTVLRDIMVNNLQEHSLSDCAELVIAYAISEHQTANIPPVILEDNVPDPLFMLALLMSVAKGKCKGNPDRLAFLFSAVSALHINAPTWKSDLIDIDEYLDDILKELKITFPDQLKAIVDVEPNRDWSTIADHLLLSRTGFPLEDTDIDRGLKKQIIRSILTGINFQDNALVAPYANTLRTVTAIKSRGIKWPELDIIQHSMLHDLRDMPALANLTV